MIDRKQQVDESANIIRQLWEKHGIKNPLKILGFCLSMLPIPVIQQSGQALDRHLSDKEFSRELEIIWEVLGQTNDAIEKIASLESAITEIAKTVAENDEIRAQCERLSSLLGEKESEFVINTEDHSYQELARSIVQATRVTISAKDSSENVILNTEIRSPHTYLHASGGSSNIISGTKFKDDSGSVGMQGISTKGNIHVTGNSIGFGSGGTLIFGGNPNLVLGECPICHTTNQIDRRMLSGLTKIQCTSCKSVLPFKLAS